MAFESLQSIGREKYGKMGTMALKLGMSKAATRDNSHYIRKILAVNARGSGQQINLQKSKITFSLDFDNETRSDIQSLLDIAEYNSQDKYLGLPAMVGRNKMWLFNDIKERVWRNIRGWKDIPFSFGGKEMLIKAVAQAVPTNSISLFQLPIGLRWVVGVGQSIKVFKDRWIPRPTTFKTVTTNPDSDLLVADLLDVNGWRRGHDSLSWHYDKNGGYTVKSGYRLAVEQSLVSSVELCRLCMIAWSIWENRISFLNSGKCKCAELVVFGAEAFLMEFQNSSSAVGELIALREGFLLAQFYNIRVDLAEVASLLVASILNDPLMSLRDSKFIINDIKTFLLYPGCYKCQAISKSGNTLAYKLARLAFSSAREFLWLDSSPVFPFFCVMLVLISKKKH
ncbi:hypothetical protein Dsin_028350 [Dipteronia sinensis]|uniref:RNase H type-1 domain-containing protein n=1 Tax=Dipteronia sinensis TaxID=43782 RepID=A0AAD9ZQZ0_9ROSI|nr:hypothetical protein Dsin_028350 [Dipteronia sinensis]